MGNTLQESCLENPPGQMSLVGYSPGGRNESDTSQQLSTAQQHTHTAADTDTDTDASQMQRQRRCIVLPDVRIPERRLPEQCNSQKKGSLLLTRIRAPAARPTQWYGVREH